MFRDPKGLFTYTANCRYISGGAIFGGGVLKCRIKGPCMKGRREVGFTETIFIGATFLSPGGVTFFDMTLTDDQYSGQPSVAGALGWSKIISASGAFEQLGGSYTEVRLGNMHYEGAGPQSGFDLSIDIMGGHTFWNDDVKDNHYWECCYENESK